MVTPEQVLSFWVDEVGPKGWYDVDPALDATIRDRFEETWRKARDGGCSTWQTSSKAALAYIVVMDQFPRNMFRGEAKAFSTDKAARAASKVSIDRNWDQKINGPERQFFYLPLMHSENLIDQDRAVRLFKSRMPEGGTSSLRHARAHRAVIRKFGRFPYRNEALGRKNTAMEEEWLHDGGYKLALQEVDGRASAEA
ncbi:DUF924 family protein [Thalassorhabdomicrobium marinisediminis]|uniref:DUF924 family protein n=1 Tax=Thalassorhabdomicrobium marinisediminis TaxID=2170577 RepID=UPI002491BE42|nr:DUF924 family protein [Thalassorhabdomicrobium marinisediminis]